MGHAEQTMPVNVENLRSRPRRRGDLLGYAIPWWLADSLAGYVLVGYAAHEVREIFDGAQS